MYNLVKDLAILVYLFFMLLCKMNYFLFWGYFTSYLRVYFWPHLKFSVSLGFFSVVFRSIFDLIFTDRSVFKVFILN